MAEIDCVRCHRHAEGLEKPPMRNDLGERVHRSVCRDCWAEWLRYQTALINHYGLDVRERDARDFLSQNMEAYFFKAGEAEEIDTSQQGQVSW
jgi:Fe-S cluster biosynthesis and repair protein YggX